MSALISNIEHSLAVAASDTVKVAKFVEQAANIERVGFAVLGVVIKAIDDAGSAAGANGLNVTLDAQLVADIKSVASTFKSAAPVAPAQ